MNSSNTPTPNFHNLLLQPLSSSRIQPRHPSLDQLPLDLEHLCNNLNLSDTLSDNEDNSSPSSSPSSNLAKEEAKLEKQIIRTISAKKYDELKPNSGQAVTIGEHPVCVGFYEDVGSDYRVWEWHGHIMMFDEEDGYTPEYIYGNHFECLTGNEGVTIKKTDKIENVVVDDDDDDDAEEEEEVDDKATNLGLKDLIESGYSNGGRILHRNINAVSPRFIF